MQRESDGPRLQNGARGVTDELPLPAARTPPRGHGVHAFARFEIDRTEMVVVNVRRLDGVALGALEVQSFDGTSS